MEERHEIQSWQNQYSPINNTSNRLMQNSESTGWIMIVVTRNKVSKIDQNRGAGKSTHFEVTDWLPHFPFPHFSHLITHSLIY